MYVLQVMHLGPQEEQYKQFWHLATEQGLWWMNRHRPSHPATLQAYAQMDMLAAHCDMLWSLPMRKHKPQNSFDAM